MRLGEYDLVDSTLMLGTAVYTKSIPDRKAAIDAKTGAP
jgi:hypothetical protein